MNAPAVLCIQTLQCFFICQLIRPKLRCTHSNLIRLGFRPASSDKRVASPSNTPPVGTTSPSPTPPATPARRGDFTRGEYARRQQLRIMEDLDKVLRQKSTNQGRSSAKKTRSRPRSMTREETQLSLSPAKGKTGKVKK